MGGPKPQSNRKNVPGRGDEAAQNAAAQQALVARKRRGRSSLLTAEQSDARNAAGRKTLG